MTAFTSGYRPGGERPRLSLLIEAALIVLSVGMLLALRQRPPSAVPSGA